MNTKVMNLSVGLFVLLGIAALFWLAFSASNTDGRFSKQIILTAQFDNIGSLKIKAPVMIAGVRVGRVSSISLDPQDYRAVVSMKVDQSYPLPSDTSAMIYTAGLVGEQYISLDPGGSEKYLENGDRIKLTQSALVIERLIGQFLTSMAGNKDSKSGE